jgi:sarcosine oxidase subunit alpha
VRDPKLQVNRLPKGGRIDRSTKIQFTFNKQTLEAYEGDTLASALLANGIDIIARSFKLHRPRGIIASGAEEPNAIMQIGEGAYTEPNLKATQVELHDGLVSYSTKGWPNLRFDIGEINNVLGRVFTAGFYYKTFMFPKSFWGLYEKFIRHSAGFGTSPKLPDPEQYAHYNTHCDVLVVGAGPAGLMAARAAAKAGARVIIADEQNEFGGSLLSSDITIDGLPACEWVKEVREELALNDEVTMLPRSTVFGYFDGNFLTIAERCTNKQVKQIQWRVRAKQVVLAQGAFERPLVFCNNDRPGIMLASAISSYIRRYGVMPGKQTVVFTNNDSAYQCALDIVENGGNVEAIIDSRQAGADQNILAQVKTAGISVMMGHIICDVEGRTRVRGVQIAKWSDDQTGAVSPSMQIDCDLVAMSGGWSPAVHLHSQSGGKNVWDEDKHCFVPAVSTQALRSVGSGNGQFSLTDCLQDGLTAGVEAARDCGFESELPKTPETPRLRDNNIEPLWRVPAAKHIDQCAKQFLDFQNDTTVADVRQAVTEGYQNVEHVKRYTALGFGTDQGKLGNINGMAVLAMSLNVPIKEVGTTTFRPCYTPTTFGCIAGESVKDLYEPVRKTAIHECFNTVPMEVVGQWLRPWYFPKGNSLKEMESLDEAVARECLATRNSVGIMDASTLGKIIVEGPDAITFLNRIYTHDIAKMKVGACTYGITLGEDGMVKDDGVMARLAENKFYLTTTTGGAAAAMSWLEIWLQTEWPELKVYLSSVTDHFSTIALVGPNSRKVLEKMECDIDLSAEAFPFMTVVDACLNGVSVQLFRVSFSGELAYEINMDSRFAKSMWESVMAAGEEFDITPYGTETMHVLRAEKGFVIVGQDTDGSVTPADLSMKWLLAKDKDFLGKRSLKRSDSVRGDRKQFVGFASEDNQSVLTEGMQLVEKIPGNNISSENPIPMLGHITSAYYSACLGYPIALGMLIGGKKRMGETIYACDSNGKTIAVKVVPSVFYDAKGERQNV